MKSKLLIAWALAAAGLGASAAPEDQITSRIVVKYRVNTAAQVQAADSRTRARIQSATDSPRQPAYIKTLANGARVYDLGAPMPMEQARRTAMTIAGSDSSVEYAAPDVWVRPHQVATPNDPSFSTQWSLKSRSVKAGAANFAGVWPLTTGAGVTVAVVDTGYTPHPDMAGKEVMGYDFVSDLTTAGDGDLRDADPTDPGNYCTSSSSNSTWHGLKVASQITALTNNGTGIAGAAPGATILQVRALGRCGGWLSDVADGIAWSVGEPVAGAPVNSTPAKVVNVSLGGASGTACYQYMQDAVNAATSHGATVVVAAGNDGSGTVGAPANCSGVIAVGAHTASADMASYSNYGPYVTLTAPGGGGCALQTSTCDNTPTIALGNTGTTSAAGPLTPDYFSGTSSAAPHVSAAIALMLQANPALLPAQIRSVLTTTAAAHPAGTYCAAHPGSCGAGMLDASAAVYAVSQPIVTFNGPQGLSPGNSTVSVTAQATGVAPFTYAWSQVSGPTVSLQNTSSATVSFTTPATASQPIVLRVTVTGANGQSFTDTTQVLINTPPVLAVTSSTTATAGQQMDLPMYVSDADSDPTIVAIVSGPSGAQIISGNILRWSNPQPGVHTFTLQAEDSAGQRSALRTVTVTVAGAGGGSSGSSGGSSGGGGGGGGATGLPEVAGLLMLTIAAAYARRRHTGTVTSH